MVDDGSDDDDVEKMSACSQYTGGREPEGGLRWEEEPRIAIKYSRLQKYRHGIQTRLTHNCGHAQVRL